MKPTKTQRALLESLLPGMLTIGPGSDVRQATVFACGEHGWLTYNSLGAWHGRNTSLVITAAGRAALAGAEPRREAFELSVMSTRGVCVDNETVEGRVAAAERRARAILDGSDLVDAVMIYRRRDDGVDWSKVVREVRA